jgi:hypothetical protein
LRNFGATETKVISVKLFGVDALLLKWFSENSLSSVRHPTNAGSYLSSPLVL